MLQPTRAEKNEAEPQRTLGDNEHGLDFSSDIQLEVLCGVFLARVGCALVCQEAVCSVAADGAYGAEDRG